MDILILESNKINAHLIKANLEKYVFFVNCDIIFSFADLKETNKEYDLYITSDVLVDSEKEHLEYLKDKKFILVIDSDKIDNNAIDYIRKSDISIINYLVKLVKRLINNKFLSVLLVNSDDNLRENKKKFLEKINLNVISTKYLRDALRIIKDNQINFLMVNSNVNDLDMISFVKEVRKYYNSYELPIIITDIDNMKKTVEALKFGANTFIQKPLNKEAFLIRFNNILDLYSFNLSKREIFYDSDTKIYNGFYLNILESFSKTIKNKSVVLLQIDNHQLIEFIEKIKKNIRKNDVIIKYDKNKILLFMPNTKKEEAYIVLSKFKHFKCSFSASIVDEGDTLVEITRLAFDRLKNKKSDYLLFNK